MCRTSLVPPDAVLERELDGDRYQWWSEPPTGPGSPWSDSDDGATVRTPSDRDGGGGGFANRAVDEQPPATPQPSVATSPPSAALARMRPMRARSPIVRR
jgi:hypothetical protein